MAVVTSRNMDGSHTEYYCINLKEVLQVWGKNLDIQRVSRYGNHFIHFMAKEIDDPIRMGVKRYFPIDSVDPNTKLWINISDSKIRDIRWSATTRLLNNEISDEQYKSICENTEGVIGVYDDAQFARYCENN